MTSALLFLNNVGQEFILVSGDDRDALFLPRDARSASAVLLS